MSVGAGAAPPAPQGTAADADPAPRTGAGRARALITLLGTLLVVGAEFALLHFVYVRAAPARDQLQLAARLDGAARVVATSPAPPAGVVAALRTQASDTLRDLASAGAPAADLTAARTAVADLTPDRTPGFTARLADATHTVRVRAADRVHGYDRQADLIYVGLLLTASVGWMVWFRRLVARHRALQAAVTEQQSLALGEQRLAALVRNAADVVLVCDLDGRVSFATPSAATVLGFAPDRLVDRRCGDLVHSDERDRFQHALAGVQAGGDDTVTARVTHADGRTMHVEGTVTNLVGDPAVGGLVITIRDVTARVHLEAELTHQAFHDSLTGLANRQLFSDRLAHALLARSGPAGQLVVLYCDLDEFKNINDSLGHGVGDQVLATVAQRTGACIRPVDTAARLGGDEFAFLLESTHVDDATAIAERILDALQRPVAVDGHSLVVGASIGLAAAVPGEVTAEEVLRNADVAMYLAKDRGKGTIAVYNEQLHAEALRRLEMRADLQQAIRDDQISVQYQPTIDLSTGAITGFEALARWTHAEHGFVSPVEFIPVAEQSGLIHALGAAVLHKACRIAVELTAAAQRPLRMSVNVTAQQLATEGFVGDVAAVLAETGLPPQQLVLEITESVLLQGIDVVRQRLGALRATGVRIAVDDFGTGYSSLSYLRDLPLDILKVDKAFVDHVTTDPTGATLTEAIIAMSRTMRLTTVAEGVEDETQAAWLRAANCSLGQGYLWSRPVPPEVAVELLVAERGSIAA